MYRIYIRDFNQQVAEKTNTHNRQAALEVFEEMVSRASLDGQKLAAVLTYDRSQLAFHRFDRHPGQPDYWRGRLSEIEFPDAPVGAPRKMEDGKRVNVYLDATSLARAAELGEGNVSEGIRRALSQSPEQTPGTPAQ